MENYKKIDIVIGLYYKKELVQVSLFKRINSKKYRLIKNCTKLNLKIEEGLNTVIKHIFKNNISKIITFIDISKYDLMEYYNMGWQLMFFTEPSYTLYKNNEKQKIEPNEISDIDITSNRILKVYDCGKAALKIQNK